MDETSTKSWGSRILSSLAGVLFGIILIIASFVLIFWNEGHGLHTAQSLEQTQHILITVSSSPLNAKNQLQVVYFSGPAATKDILSDNMFGISENALKLERKVEMYQWEENAETTTKKNYGGSETETKTYQYKQVWSEHLIDSNVFKEQSGHQNPAKMVITTKKQYADHVTVGDFILPESLIQQLSGETPVDLSKVDLAKLQSKLHKKIQLQDDEIYAGDDPSAPKIGDYIISFNAILPQKVSVIAQQVDNTLQPYIAPAGQPVSLIAMGQQSPQKMIEDAAYANSMMMWIFRVVSLIMMITGHVQPHRSQRSRLATRDQ